MSGIADSINRIGVDRRLYLMRHDCGVTCCPGFFWFGFAQRCAAVRAFKRTGRANLIAAFAAHRERRDGFQLLRPRFLPRMPSTGPSRSVVSLKSIHRQFCLPSAIRSPRPAPCTYSTGLCVGRNQMMQSTSGTSNPVASASTVTRQRTSPRRNDAMRCSRSFFGVSPQTTSVGMPRWLSRGGKRLGVGKPLAKRQSTCCDQQPACKPRQPQLVGSR